MAPKLADAPPPPTPEELAQREADSQRMREDAKHPVDDLTGRPWTQSQPRNPKTTMEINMFLREIAAATDGLCIRATVYIADNDA